MAYHRYAIYVTPRPGELAEFGAAWLGWDPETGSVRVQPAIEGLPRTLDQITAAPRRYGFHGTIKPPFRLAEGADPEGLSAALDAFCARQAPVAVAGLALTRLGRFLALCPVGDTAALDALAAAAVARLDAFRAPPGAARSSRAAAPPG